MTQNPRNLDSKKWINRREGLERVTRRRVKDKINYILIEDKIPKSYILINVRFEKLS